MLRDEPQRVEDARAAVDEVADEDRLAALRGGRRPAPPVGDRASAVDDLVAELLEQLLQLVAAAVDVADDVERAVLVACGRSTAASRSIVAASTSSGESSTKTWRKPSRCRPAQRPAQLRALLADDVRAEVAVGPAAVPLLAEPLGQVRARSATGRQWYSRASSTSGLRASGCTLVASMTVSRPSASRLAATKCSTSKASFVAAWSFSSSRPGRGRRRTTAPRSAGSACGRTCSCRSRGADQDDEGELGDRASCDRSAASAPSTGVEHPHLRRRPDAPGLPARPAGTARRSRTARRRRSAQRLELRARPLEAVVAVAELARPAASRTSRCTPRFGVVSDDRLAAGRTRTATRSNAASRGGSRCSTTSTTAAASKPSSRSSR